MTALIVLGSIITYLAIAIAIARPIYGYARARSLDYNVRRHGSLYGGDPASAWDRMDKGFVMLATVLLAIFWPAAWVYPAFAATAPLFARWVQGTSIRSETEKNITISQQRKAIAERDRHIASLERELGIK